MSTQVNLAATAPNNERIINMRYMISVVLIIAISVLLLSCKKDEGPIQPVVPDPVASFTYIGVTVTPATIAFQNTSQNADSFLWDFGDSTTSTDSCPMKSYQVAGTYSVRLTASRTSTGKSHSVTQQLVINPGRVFVDVISVDQIPSTKANGFPWDLGSGPDLYVTFNDNTDVLVTFRSRYCEDVNPAYLPISWIFTSPYEIADWSKPCYVVCWDLDTFEADDCVGTTDGFSINGLISLNGHASIVQLQNSVGTLKASLHLIWQ